MTNSYDVDHGLSQCPPGPLEPIELAPAKAPDIRVEVEPDPRGVSVGVWQGSHCIYSGAHPLPAAPASPVSTVEDAQADQPYCYALETRGPHGEQQNVLLDTEYNGTNSFSGGRQGGFPLYRRPVPAAGDAQTDAARDVLAERLRQISVEGWEPERDDTYRHGELASAAASYAQCAGLQGEGATTENAFKEPFAENWPWSEAWWKPSADPRRNLVKAGALILAEIERLDRAAIAAQRQGDA